MHAPFLALHNGNAFFLEFWSQLGLVPDLATPE